LPWRSEIWSAAIHRRFFSPGESKSKSGDEGACFRAGKSKGKSGDESPHSKMPLQTGGPAPLFR
jgi:hypothetical protein